MGADPLAENRGFLHLQAIYVQARRAGDDRIAKKALIAMTRAWGL